MELDYDKILREYNRNREIGFDLNIKIIKNLESKDLASAAKSLGIHVKGKTFIFDNEQEMDILLDFAIYSVLTNGRSLVDRCALEPPFEVTDEERRLLKVMAESRYSVLVISDFVAGVGFYAYNILGGEDEIFVADRLCSQTGTTKIPIASRLIPCGDFFMSTGVGLPIVPRAAAAIKNILLKHIEDVHYVWSKKRDSRIAEQVIRLLLRQGASERVLYGASDESLESNLEVLGIENPRFIDESDYVPPHQGGKRKIGRNEPCPCGSGKKYKKCCGKG